MQPRNYAPLVAELAEGLKRHSPRSASLNQEAVRTMVDGGSHAMRLIEPFPPRIKAAHGAWLTDEDGHQILDFWQGHFANVLGHNPAVVTSVLSQAFAGGFGLQCGFTDRLQVEVAELLCQRTGSERVRFTTSGSLATMYAIMLARGFTGRELVMKVGGGWHGAQPWGLKGVSFAGKVGFDVVESAGLPAALTGGIVVARYNDPQNLVECFRQFGDQVACLIVEPVMGAGGGMLATPEFIRTARELTQQSGAVLVFDEVIAGFRFRAGDAGRMYGVSPDLATFGKIMGGGMPLAAVGGRADIMNLAGRAGGGRVKFYGGTYSGHPATMLAAKTMLTYLVEHEGEVYPRLEELSDRAARLVEDVFAGAGMLARCAGAANSALPRSSVLRVHFPHRADQTLETPEDVLDPAKCDVALPDKVLRLALLLENVNTEHGLGAISTAHTDADLEVLRGALERVAARLRPYRS